MLLVAWTVKEASYDGQGLEVHRFERNRHDERKVLPQGAVTIFKLPEQKGASIYRFTGCIRQ